MYVLQAFNYDIEKASATMVSLREGPASPLPPATVTQPVQETAAGTSSQTTSGNKGGQVRTCVHCLYLECSVMRTYARMFKAIWRVWLSVCTVYSQLLH